MAGESSNGIPNGQAPTISHDAVFKPSAPVPEDIPSVGGVEFNDYDNRRPIKTKDITVAEMVSNMANMGFQATALAEAARIINDMVSYISPLHHQSSQLLINVPRKTGEIPPLAPKPPFSSATLPISYLPDFAKQSATSLNISTSLPS